jgi:hypothetical protein
VVILQFLVQSRYSKINFLGNLYIFISFHFISQFHIVYDVVICDARHWVDPKRNIRSAAIFHTIISADYNKTIAGNPPEDWPSSPLFIANPCAQGAYYYSDYLRYNLWRNMGRNRTVVIASEELEQSPHEVLRKLLRILQQHNYSSSGLPNVYAEPSDNTILEMLGNFTDQRINSQDHKGGTESVPTSIYRPGVYAVSKYEPLYELTRQHIDTCWARDCVFVSQVLTCSLLNVVILDDGVLDVLQVSGYLYEACLNTSLQMLRAGQWHSWTDIYGPSSIHHSESSQHDPIH